MTETNVTALLQNYSRFREVGPSHRFENHAAGSLYRYLLGLEAGFEQSATCGTGDCRASRSEKNCFRRKMQKPSFGRFRCSRYVECFSFHRIMRRPSTPTKTAVAP